MRLNITEQLHLAQSLMSQDHSPAEALYVVRTVMALHALGELSQLEKADPVRKIGWAFLELVSGGNVEMSQRSLTADEISSTGHTDLAVRILRREIPAETASLILSGRNITDLLTLDKFSNIKPAPDVWGDPNRTIGGRNFHLYKKYGFD